MATRSPSMTRRRTRFTCAPSWQGHSGSPRRTYGCSRPTSAAASVRDCAPGRTRSSPRSPPAPSHGRSSSPSPALRCSRASGNGPAPFSTSRSPPRATANWWRSTTRARRPPRWVTSVRLTSRCDRCSKRSTIRRTRSPSARPRRMPAPTSPPATSACRSTSHQSRTCGHRGRRRATSRSSRSSTSSRTSSG